jgi:hypothetical protein
MLRDLGLPDDATHVNPAVRLHSDIRRACQAHGVSHAGSPNPWALCVVHHCVGQGITIIVKPV